MWYMQAVIYAQWEILLLKFLHLKNVVMYFNFSELVSVSYIKDHMYLSKFFDAWLVSIKIYS